MRGRCGHPLAVASLLMFFFYTLWDKNGGQITSDVGDSAERKSTAVMRAANAAQTYAALLQRT